MDTNEFCKFLIISIINLVAYLLSIIFLTSVYNIKDQCKINFINCPRKTYKSHYSAISACFSFETISFALYLVSLIYFIFIWENREENIEENKEKNKENNNEENNQQNRKANNISIYAGKKGDESERGTNNGNGEKKIEELNKQNIEINSNLTSDRVVRTDNEFQEKNEEPENKLSEKDKNMWKINIISTIICQVLYIIEVIILTASLAKSNELDNKESELRTFTLIYVDLVIVGYIFLIILVFCYLYLIIIFDICGKGIKEKLLIENNSLFCGSCNRGFVILCEKCIKIVETDDKKTQIKKEKEALKKEIQVLERNIQSLKKYQKYLSLNIQNLKNINIR